MTGFGQGSAQDQHGQLQVQLSAVNNRTWSVHLRSDLHDLSLDERIRQELKAQLVRGSLTAQVAYHPNRTLGLDLERLDAAWRELAARAHALGAPPPALEAVAGLLPAGRAHAASQAAPLVEAALAQAIQALQQMRAQEGAALARDLLSHAADLRRMRTILAEQATARAAHYRQSLQERLAQVLTAQVLVTPEHLVRELALHAERIDVSEELVRLSAHLDALDALLASPDDAIGRKLEFLLQELAREVNTTAAKANDAALTASTLQAKYVIEQMKEQAANIA
jgi:uncharacterized protein YicC (UPF0701 family)